MAEKKSIAKRGQAEESDITNNGLITKASSDA